MLVCQHQKDFYNNKGGLTMSIRDEEQQLEKLGAFEISNEMLKLDLHNKKVIFFSMQAEEIPIGSIQKHV